MQTKFIRQILILLPAVVSFGILSSAGSDKDTSNQPAKITKSQAERIAVKKVSGGRVRTAELEQLRGRQVWAVYIGKPGSKDAKEILVDAATGQILKVQTEKPGDEAEEPLKGR
jgi:hypothetical protein